MSRRSLRVSKAVLCLTQMETPVGRDAHPNGRATARQGFAYRLRKRFYLTTSALVPSINGRISPTNLSLFTILRSTILMASSGNPDSSVNV